MVASLYTHGAEAGRIRWASSGEDRRAKLEGRFGEWIETIAASKVAFTQYVYENAECTDGDLRQHRMYLYQMLAVGEGLVIDLFVETQAHGPGLERMIELADQKLDELRAVLHEWHGPVGDATLPESLKAAYKELQSGEVGDLSFDQQA